MIGSNSPGILCLIKDRERDQSEREKYWDKPVFADVRGADRWDGRGFTLNHFSSGSIKQLFTRCWSEANSRMVQ
jgi:hypothetical protein